MVPNNDDGLIIIPEDHIVSEEDYFMEEDEDDSETGEDEPTIPANAEEVVVADLDDNIEAVPCNTRPKRVNAGAGVERLQMDFSGKEYGTKREFYFVTNGEQVKLEAREPESTSYMKMSCDVIFTQISANAGIKNMENQQWR